MENSQTIHPTVVVDMARHRGHVQSPRAEQILLGIAASGSSPISWCLCRATSHEVGGGSGLELPHVLGCFPCWEGDVLTLWCWWCDGMEITTWASLLWASVGLFIWHKEWSHLPDERFKCYKNVKTAYNYLICQILGKLSFPPCLEKLFLLCFSRVAVLCCLPEPICYLPLAVSHPIVTDVKECRWTADSAPPPPHIDYKVQVPGLVRDISCLTLASCLVTFTLLLAWRPWGPFDLQHYYLHGCTPWQGPNYYFSSSLCVMSEETNFALLSHCWEIYLVLNVTDFIWSKEKKTFFA